MIRIPLALLFVFLTGCSATYLSVHTDYLSHENLASYHVQTPDPRLNNPPIGQRLIITWSISQEYLELDDIHLEVTLRFRNSEQITQNLDVFKRRGTYVYQLLNEDYIAKRGILTYKVDLVGNGQILDQWQHQMWSELIILNSTNTDTTENIQTPVYDENFE